MSVETSQCEAAGDGELDSGNPRTVFVVETLTAIGPLYFELFSSSASAENHLREMMRVHSDIYFPGEGDSRIRYVNIGQPMLWAMLTFEDNRHLEMRSYEMDVKD